VTWQERFERFHNAHPNVYEELVRLCRIWRSRGRDLWSITGAYEVLRWERHLLGLPDQHEEYKLNNNYCAYYARLIMRQEPDLVGIFNLRELRSTDDREDELWWVA